MSRVVTLNLISHTIQSFTPVNNNSMSVTRVSQFSQYSQPSLTSEAVQSVESYTAVSLRQSGYPVS
jgi:hypothetical protein